MEIGEPVSVALAVKPVIHASLLIKEVTFGGNHPVEQDTLGNFAAPEWVRGRSKQWPVCYTRGKPVKITAKFSVTGKPTSTETVSIRAKLQVGSATLEWTGSVTVNPSDAEVVTAELTSSASLPNEVNCFDPAKIEFFYTAPSEPESSAGSSQNILYVVLADPSGTPAYWTLLDISCRAAAGVTSQADLVTKSYTPFTSRALKRERDSKGLTYWNPRTTKATNTKRLLESGDGSGQCGSWSEFLVDMHKVHGITSSAKVLVVINVPVWQASSAGFLVKNWQFRGTGSHPAPWTHEMYTECVEKRGIPGQRNPNPPPAFFNHFIVFSFGQFYDPSYGGGPIKDQIDWEAGAIDGLFSGSRAGYPKSAHLTTKLLEFWNLTTSTKI